MLGVSYYIIPLFILLNFIMCIKNKTNAYESFINGAKEGISISLQILPYIMAMYVAVYVFEASGILSLFNFFSNLPSELIFEGLFRPVSGYAAEGFMIKIFEDYHPDSKIGIASSLLLGSTDTTIYVYSLYFAAIKIKRAGYAYFVGITTDILCFVLTLLILYFYL